MIARSKDSRGVPHRQPSQIVPGPFGSRNSKKAITSKLGPGFPLTYTPPQRNLPGAGMASPRPREEGFIGPPALSLPIVRLQSR